MQKTNLNPSCTMKRITLKIKSCYHPLALAVATAALLNGIAQAQITLEPAWRVTPDTNSPGFKWAYFQAGANTGDSVARAESDVALQSTYTNLADPNILG